MLLQRSTQFLRNTGLLWCAPVKANVVQRIAEVMQSLGLKHELIDGSEVERRYPMLHYDDNIKALIDPTAGVLYADRCLQAMQVRGDRRFDGQLIAKRVQNRYRQLGGAVRDASPVTGITPHGERSVSVHCADGSAHRARSLIVAVGPWAPQFLQEKLNLNMHMHVRSRGASLVHGANLRLQTEVVKVCYWRDTSDGAYSTARGFPCIITEDEHGHFYGLPSAEYPGLFKVGLTIVLPIANVLLAHQFCNHTGYKAPPEQRDNVSNEVLEQTCVAPVRDHLSKHMKHLVTVRPDVTETCMYTVGGSIKTIRWQCDARCFPADQKWAHDHRSSSATSQHCHLRGHERLAVGTYSTQGNF